MTLVNSVFWGRITLWWKQLVVHRCYFAYGVVIFKLGSHVSLISKIRMNLNFSCRNVLQNLESDWHITTHISLYRVRYLTSQAQKQNLKVKVWRLCKRKFKIVLNFQRIIIKPSVTILFTEIYAIWADRRLCDEGKRHKDTWIRELLWIKMLGRTPQFSVFTLFPTIAEKIRFLNAVAEF